MKRLLILLDKKATTKLESLIELVIAKFKLEEKDRTKAYPQQYKFKTVYPDNQPSQEEWFKEFRVSMLYDRQTVYIG
jgi:hypothetical protein